MSDKVISVLNDLIETSNNGEKGFSTAAEDTSNPELHTVFQGRARDCARAVNDLRQIVLRLGGKPDEGGTVAGAAHRGWLNLKASVTGRSDLAILEECERGEDVAKAHYRKAVENDLPPEILSVVERQYEGVKKNHDQIRDLRDRHRAQSA